MPYRKKELIMEFLKALSTRRSYYHINKTLPVPEETVIETVQAVTEATPDAFNMKSARTVVVLGDKQDLLWDAVYDVFGGKVAREKIDSFKNGAGTILYFIDETVVAAMQKNVPAYAHNFPVWANQANGMLQFNLWTALRTLGVGASLQHYNPVIDETVKRLFEIPKHWTLIAEMPFGGIEAEPDPKEKEEISRRVWIKK